MFKTSELFYYGKIDEIVPDVIYYYLFKGLSLTAIEMKLFSIDTYKGWISKVILNYYGIDTEKENKGIYMDRSVKEVIKELEESCDDIHIKVSKILKDKYM